MRDHTRLRAVEPLIELKVVETKKGLIGALRNVSWPSDFSLQSKHLSSCRDLGIFPVRGS
jgi:hypothetical protein